MRQDFSIYADHRELIGVRELKLTTGELANASDSYVKISIPKKNPFKEGIPHVKVTNKFAAARRNDGGRMHDRGPISRQQTTDSDTGRRKSRAIRNELSDCNRRGAFTRVHNAAYPGTCSARRIARAIYDRRCGLRPEARLSGFLPDGRRQLHGVRRSDLLSPTA